MFLQISNPIQLLHLSSQDIMKVLCYRIIGTLKKYLKSERLPNNQQLKVNNMYQLVGENFESIVMKENEFVFVMFTRRNCGLCNEVI